MRLDRNILDNSVADGVLAQVIKIVVEYFEKLKEGVFIKGI